jgi:hypothetical protein
MPLLVTAADIASAILRINGAAQGVSAIFANCTGLDAGTRAAWTAWYADYQQWATTNDDLGYFTLGLPQIGNQTVAYESDVAQWQTIANQKCGTTIPVLVPQTDIANTNASLPSGTADALKYGAILAGIIVLGLIAVPIVGAVRDVASRKRAA